MKYFLEKKYRFDNDYINIIKLFKEKSASHNKIAKLFQDSNDLLTKYNNLETSVISYRSYFQQNR